MAPDPDDDGPTDDRTGTHDTVAAAPVEGGYGERALSEEVSAEQARRHASRVEDARSGTTDTQGITRTDAPQSPTRRSLPRPGVRGAPADDRARLEDKCSVTS